MFCRPRPSWTWNRSGTTRATVGVMIRPRSTFGKSSAIQRVVQNPMIGRACDEVRTGYRRHAVGSHTLYYRLAGADGIDVVRILHERMDVDRQLD